MTYQTRDSNSLTSNPHRRCSFATIASAISTSPTHDRPPELRIGDSIEPDVQRAEQPWMTAQETMLGKIGMNSSEYSGLHDIRARRYRRRFRNISILSITFPILFEGIDNMGMKDYRDIAFPLGMTLVAALNCIQTFLNDGGRSQRHYQAASQYSQLADDISIMLSIPRAYRIPCDVFMERVRIQYGHINEHAPDLAITPP